MAPAVSIKARGKEGEPLGKGEATITLPFCARGQGECSGRMSLRQGLGGGGEGPEGSGVSLAPSPDCWGRAGWALEVKGNSQAQSWGGSVPVCGTRQIKGGLCMVCGAGPGPCLLRPLFSGAVPTLQ